MSKAPYGTWDSPVTAEAITSSTPRLANILVDSSKSTVYHIEARAFEKGRNVLIDTSSDTEILEKDVNVRTGVHEYGGGAIIIHEGSFYYSNFADGRVYKKSPGQNAVQITLESKVYRYADFNVHPTSPRFIVAVLEDHTVDEPQKVVNKLCIIDAESQKVLPLVSGTDFYAAPRFSPDGTHIAWQQWSLADMPWEGGEIYVADVAIDASGVSITNDVHVAGESSKTSAAYPFWLSNDTILFMTDASGYQNPWSYKLGGKAMPILKTSIDEDFAEPPWQLGWAPFAPVDMDGRFVLVKALREGHHILYLLDVTSGAVHSFDSPYVHIGDIFTLSLSEHKAVFLGSKVDAGFGIVQCTISLPTETSPAKGAYDTVMSYKGLSFPDNIVSIPRSMTLTIAGEPVHVIYHPAHNPAYIGSSIDGEKPPCVVHCHGGPTGMAYQDLNWTVQYFTTRGFGWLSVNYGGSSGYGRKYVERLAGKWGVLDPSDVTKAAQALGQPPHSLVDPKRLVIRGGSSGGYTVLAALALLPDVNVFAAATSLYGISDLIGLSEHSHKFENTYMDKLLGGSYQENPKVFVDRSPLINADRIVVPLLILQGDIDRVVPKEQAQLIYESIQKRGGIADMQIYEGEGHGWRRDDTMKDALERELAFYKKILNL